jgi:hypothetical protein
MKNRLLVIGALALSTLTLASAKTYDIMLTQASKAGSVQLAPGEYHLKLQGNNVIFTNLDSNKKYTVPVKVENSDKKYDVTAVDTNSSGGSSTVESIELGGSTTKLGF